MPTPLGHGLAGLTLHVGLANGEAELRDSRRVLVVAGAALAPDLDLLLRLVDGRNHHQAESHSVGCAVLAGLLAWVVTRRLRWPRAGPLGACVGLAWLSHVLLDYLGGDTNPPIGVMALWPLSTAYHKSSWMLFLDIGRTLDWARLRSNAVAAAWEAVVLAPLLAGVSWLRRARG